MCVFALVSDDHDLMGLTMARTVLILKLEVVQPSEFFWPGQLGGLQKETGREIGLPHRRSSSVWPDCLIPTRLFFSSVMPEFSWCNGKRHPLPAGREIAPSDASPAWKPTSTQLMSMSPSLQSAGSTPRSFGSCSCRNLKIRRRSRFTKSEWTSAPPNTRYRT
jgi:hypothetical protein